MEKQTFQIFPNYFVHILKFTGVHAHTLPVSSTKYNIACSLFGLTMCFIVQGLSIPAVKYFDSLPDDSPIEVISSDRGSILTKFVKCFYPVIMSTTPLVAILNTLWKCKPLFPRYMKRLQQSDQIFNDKFTQEQKQFARTFITCCLWFSVPIKLLSITTLMILHDVDSYLILFWVISLYFVDLIGFVTEIQFMVLCNSLRIRFKEINNKLDNTFLPHDIKLEFRMRNFVRNWKFSRGQINVESAERLFAQNTKCLPALSLKCGQNQMFLSKKLEKHFPIFVVPLVNFRKDFSEYLNKEFACILNNAVNITVEDFSLQVHKLRLSYRHLNSALGLLKAMYEYVLLASIFTSFLLILLNVYFVIYGFVKIFILSNRFDVFFWILKSLCRFIGLLVMSDLTGKEATLTLEKLGNYASLSITKSTKEELRFFCQEIASHHLFISCAFNLFALKTTLITAAAAASTTYVVILVQLH